MQQTSKCNKQANRDTCVAHSSMKLFGACPYGLHALIFISTLSLSMIVNCFKGSKPCEGNCIPPGKTKQRFLGKMANMSHGYDIRAGTTTCGTALHSATTTLQTPQCSTTHNAPQCQVSCRCRLPTRPVAPRAPPQEDQETSTEHISGSKDLVLTTVVNIPIKDTYLPSEVST